MAKPFEAAPADLSQPGLRRREVTSVSVPRRRKRGTAGLSFQDRRTGFPEAISEALVQPADCPAYYGLTGRA